MRPWPLKWRVGLCVTALLVIVVAVVSAVAYQEFRETLLGDLDRTLGEKARGVVQALASHESAAEVQREVEVLVGSTGSARSAVYRVWLDGSSEDLLASRWLETWPLDWSPEPANAPEPETAKLRNVSRAGKAFRLLWLRCTHPRAKEPSPRVLNVVVGAYRGKVEHEAEEFFGVLLVLSGSLLLVLILATIGIVHWSLKPIARLTSDMKHITAENLDRPPADSPPAPAELRPFVEEWRNMLERLALAMRQQRRFSADASHELRTPLAVVKSTLQTIRSRRRSAESYESAIDQSLEDLGRLERLAEQLLAMARLGEPPDESTWRPIDLAHVVGDVCDQYAPMASQRGVTVTRTVCPAQVRGQEELLRSMLGNLVDNAIKHGPDRGTVAVEVHPPADGRMRVSIRDEGGGIPPGMLDRIFDPFYRASGARDRQSGGTGLGLALAAGIARRHHGKITVESAHDTGTVFVVELPCLLG